MKRRAIAWCAAIACSIGSMRASAQTVEEPEAAVVDSTTDRGIGAFQRGDYAAAREELRRARREGDTTPDLALLLGISEFELGHERAAEPLLRIAARSDQAETRDSAKVFLALIARSRGAVDAAQGALGDVLRSRDAAFRDGGSALMRAVTPHLLNLVFLLRPEFDSNVPLLPMAPLATASTQQMDGDVLFLASISVRPFRKVGFFFDETASYRQQFTLLDYSFFINSVGAHYVYLGLNDRPALGYSFEVMTLGRSFFGLGHVVEATYRRRLWADLGVGLRYAFHYRNYALTDYSAFDGPTHEGNVEVAWGTPERPHEVVLAYVVLREDTADPTFAAVGQGASLRTRFRLSRRVELAVDGWAIYRTFDVENPSLGARIDTQLHADVSLAIDLTRHVGFIIGGSVLRNISTVPDFDYLKLTAHLGLAIGYAGPKR
jgi:hypothetical protein